MAIHILAPFLSCKSYSTGSKIQPFKDLLANIARLGWQNRLSELCEENHPSDPDLRSDTWDLDPSAEYKILLTFSVVFDHDLGHDLSLPATQ